MIWRHVPVSLRFKHVVLQGLHYIWVPKHVIGTISFGNKIRFFMESNVLLARESIIISITHLILEVLAPPTQHACLHCARWHYSRGSSSSYCPPSTDQWHYSSSSYCVAWTADSLNCRQQQQLQCNRWHWAQAMDDPARAWLVTP